jgi:hypothetical protein
MPSRRFLGVFLCGGLVLLAALVLSRRPVEEPPVAEQIPDPSQPPWFADVTNDVGLNFVHDPGPVGTYFFPQIIGSGAAFLDFDNDGLMDIFLIQNAGPNSKSVNRLFRQTSEGKFVDVTAGSGLDVAGYGMGVAVGDVNNDGWPDILITEYGRLRLFRNNGNGTFTDVTKDSGLDNPRWGTSAAFFDFDRDGWLDLIVVNYVDYDPAITCTFPGGRKGFCEPNTFSGTVSRLFHNVSGKPGLPAGAIRFEDVTVASGLGTLPGPGLGVLCADFNGDHWPDILIANDLKANRLWINQHDGTFKEEAVIRAIATNRLGQAEANMGIALGDVDGDGEWDIFITHLAEETHTFWRQGPKGRFRDATIQSRITASHWRGTGFGTVLADFDNDGALDLAIVNGRIAEPRTGVRTATGTFWGPYLERNQLFANNGHGEFRDISLSNPAFCGAPAVSRGLACADVNNDGGLDLLVTAIGAPARFYRNVAPNRGHWLIVRAVDPRLKRDAYGAEVTVSAGEKKWFRQVNPGYSYACSNDPRAHFGLGKAEHVDRIHVVWPDGLEEDFAGGRVDRMLTLTRGAGPKP